MSEHYSLVVGRFVKRAALRFWNEPRFVVRFFSALVPLSFLAALIWWLA